MIVRIHTPETNRTLGSLNMYNTEELLLLLKSVECGRQLLLVTSDMGGLTVIRVNIEDNH